MTIEQGQKTISVGSVEPETPTTDRGVTLRSIIIGFFAIIPAVWWGVYGDVISQTDLTSTSLMMPPILILSVLLVLNKIVKRFRRNWALTQSELITIYVMLTVSVILSGMGMLQFLCTTLGAVPHFSTPENNYTDYLGYVQHSSYFLPKLSAIDGFYKGGQPIPFSAWKMPIITWSCFLFTMLFCMMCINTMVRKQWMDRERLSFPIVQLPLEMTDPKTSFFRSKTMWAGFFIAAGLESMNSLSFLYPNVPYIRLTSYDLSQYFSIAPWNSIGYFPSTFYPLAIGLGFLLSADVSFACWFFYLLTKVQNISVAAIGWKGGATGTLSSPPYLGQQGAGAFIGIVIVVIYLARHHLKDVFLKAFRRDPGIDDSGEPMSYQTAVCGLMVGFAIMVYFCFLIGMSPLVAMFYLAIYLVFATTITRLRAEAGPAWTMGPDLNAMDSLIQPVGSGLFSRQNLVALAYFNWFSVEMRCCPMPVQIEGMKMAQATQLRQRALAIVMLFAIVVGIAIGFWACLGVWYKYGAGTAKVEQWRTFMGKVPFDRITDYIKNPTRVDIAGIIAMSFGACFTFFLSYLRTRFVWFPLHPAGYVLASTGTMYWLWCPFMIAWICKVVITKYAGIRGYRAALPFFLGLVLGDYIAASLWAIVASLRGIMIYRCFPC